MRVHDVVVAVHLTSLFAGALFAPPAAAQYRWVGPDGTVSYGDKAPPGARDVATSPTAAAQAPADPTLPVGLRSTATKFPVTLYTTDSCNPCESARDHLIARGVPFVERTVRTFADFEAYKKLGFAGDGFPAITIGRDRSRGFESAALDRLLDAAGYPKSSTLPRNYRHAPAQAMTAPAQAMTAPAQAMTAPAPAAVEPAATPSTDSPPTDASRPTPLVGGGRAQRDPAPDAAGPTLRF
jgi:glutaredoxin